eukprot:1183019-Prorocentrum_minimum.AAC.2
MVVHPARPVGVGVIPVEIDVVGVVSGVLLEAVRVHRQQHEEVHVLDQALHKSIYGVRRGSGGGHEGKYRSSVGVREPHSLTKSEEYQRHLQGFPGVRRGSRGGREGCKRGARGSILKGIEKRWRNG